MRLLYIYLQRKSEFYPFLSCFREQKLIIIFAFPVGVRLIRVLLYILCSNELLFATMHEDLIKKHLKREKDLNAPSLGKFMIIFIYILLVYPVSQSQV